ncbi:MAG: hypothetical protein KF870_10415 [Leadbetterella sp.]|nr:hypothetical protein [Leadbetterella sp.]
MKNHYKLILMLLLLSACKVKYAGFMPASYEGFSKEQRAELPANTNSASSSEQKIIQEVPVQNPEKTEAVKENRIPGKSHRVKVPKYRSPAASDSLADRPGLMQNRMAQRDKDVPLKTDPFGVISTVFGLAAALGFWVGVGLLDAIGGRSISVLMIFSYVAVVLGIISLIRTRPKKKQFKGRGWAWLGTLSGFSVAGFLTIFLLAWSCGS